MNPLQNQVNEERIIASINTNPGHINKNNSEQLHEIKHNDDAEPIYTDAQERDNQNNCFKRTI